jgi:hypothetical protein
MHRTADALLGVLLELPQCLSAMVAVGYPPDVQFFFMDRKTPEMLGQKVPLKKVQRGLDIYRYAVEELWKDLFHKGSQSGYGLLPVLGQLFIRDAQPVQLIDLRGKVLLDGIIAVAGVRRYE